MLILKILTIILAIATLFLASIAEIASKTVLKIGMVTTLLFLASVIVWGMAMF